MRPLPLPSRSARRFAVSGPVITASAGWIDSLQLIDARKMTGDGSTLSTAVAVTVTATSLPSGGQIDDGDTDLVVNTGPSRSATVTWNVPCAKLPCASVALHGTIVVPSGNVEPDDGVHVTTSEMSTRSDALALQVAIAPDGPVALIVKSPGSVSEGAVVSCTVTVKLNVPHCTVVVPSGNVEPEAGEHVAVPGSNVTTAPDGPVASTT